MTYWLRLTCFSLVAIGCIPTNVNAEVTSIVCKVKSPQDDSPRIFELILDREERRILECFRSRSGIVTQEFSEISIAAECPISEGGKRSFRLTRDTGAVTVSEVLTKPIVSRRTLTGECEVGQIPPSTPHSAEVPGSAVVLKTWPDDPSLVRVSKAKNVSYADLLRLANLYNGSEITLKGKIEQSLEDGGMLRVSVTPDDNYRYFTDGVLISYSNFANPSLKLIEGDIVEFIGVFMGTRSYKSVLGASITVPFITSSRAQILSSRK